MDFSRQEYWSGSPGDLPHPGIKPPSSALKADSSPSEPPGKVPHIISFYLNYLIKGPFSKYIHSQRY